MKPDSIGKRLKALRARRGLSLRALAVQANVLRVPCHLSRMADAQARA